jgi:divalent metal cation (Fe/Co/Zn/Cd) transporter
VLLFALAVCVVAAAGWSLPTRAGASFSGPGLFISIAAIPVMWVLSRRKLRIVDALGSRALRTDAVESLTCGWFSLVVVMGLLAQLMLAAWWVDSVASLTIVWLLAKEGWEALKGDDCSEWVQSRSYIL